MRSDFSTDLGLEKNDWILLVKKGNPCVTCNMEEDSLHLSLGGASSCLQNLLF